jgi:hypothetical protein
MISFENYFKRMKSLELQFRTLQSLALKPAGRASDRERLTALLEDWTSVLEDTSRKWTPAFKEPTELQSQDVWSKYLINYLAAETKNVPSATELAQRLSQNELILRLALFELFMKDVHRAVLIAHPYSLPSDRSIPLGKLISAGVSVILEEEIGRAVASLDRKTYSERAKYFKTVLALNCFSKDSIATLKKLNHQRNILLYENPDLELSDVQLQRDYPVFIEVPWWAVAIGSQKYPGQFSAPPRLETGPGP